MAGVLLERLARWATTRRRNDLGARGERLAADHLRRRGHTIVEMNWRCDAGEIDVICRDGRTLVFVEVKTRADESVATPEDQVHDRKQRQVLRAAEVYLKRFGERPPPARVDVVAIVWPPRGRPVVRHHVDAFTPGDH